MPLADGTTFAGYLVERRLGSGGMGEVYLAQHPRLPRHDALKVLRSDVSADPDYQRRFDREADLAAKLWHPHIVGIHDRGKDDGCLWISMDFVDGTDVSHLLRDRFPHGMPVTLAVEIVKAVGSALDYAHGRGLLHRDVKPANILVSDVDTPDRRILLADFGVARAIGESGDTSLTGTNMTVGTAAYAAPEQLSGHRLDGRADQYALAATAYHLLAGSPPFVDSNQAVVIGMHLTAPPPPVSRRRPELAALDGVIARGMAKNPAARFATCSELARALEHPQPTRPDPVTVQHLSAPPTALAPQRPTPTPRPLSPARSTGRVAAIAAGAVVLVVAVAAAACLVSRPDDPNSADPPVKSTMTKVTATRPGDPSITTTTTTTTSAPQDPERAALAQLQDLAAGDRVDVANSLADRWIPQISSKRVGLVAEGQTWTDQSILAEHERLRSMYPDVKLLWSGDWSTFDAGDFWVTVVGLPSADPNSALTWCTQNGFDRDSCIAKLVSTTHPVGGTTAFNP